MRVAMHMYPLYYTCMRMHNAYIHVHNACNFYEQHTFMRIMHALFKQHTLYIHEDSEKIKHHQHG